MYSHILLIVGVLLSLIQSVILQVPTIEVVTKKPFKCNSNLELRCTPNTCCSSNNRFWWKGGNTIINSGTSTDLSKYNETVGSSYLTMTIYNLNESDFTSQYRCSYDTKNSDYITLDSSAYCCTPNFKCGGECFGYSIIGVLIVLLIGFGVTFAIAALKEKRIMFIVLISISGLILDFVLFPIGSYTCWCAAGTVYVCIFVGFAVTISVVPVVGLIVAKVGKGSSASNSSSGTGTGTGPSNKESKPVKKEKKENSPAHVKTDNTTPRSKLDDVPLHRPLPQIGGTTSPSTTGHPDPDKRNITKLPPMEMTSESEEKKKKKKKKKKQSDGLANDGYDD